MFWQHQRFLNLFMVFFIVFFGGSCGGGDSASDGTSESSDEFSSGECDGFCGTEQIDVGVDLSEARALFTVEAEESSSASLTKNLSSQNLTTSTSSPLYAVTDDGIQAVLEAFNPSGDDVISDLPRLSFVAVSPIGEVVLAFEHPWIYRNEADGVTIDQYSDPWSSSSPFTCQLFVVNQLISSASAPEGEMNLSCIKNGIEINTWDSRTKRIQFDESGNAYFAAHVPGNWKDLLFKYTTAHSGPDSTATTETTVPEGQITEIINANICFERFLITNAGGVLYTGRTSTTGECQGDSFFRFVTPDGALQQVSLGWWDYVFAPIEANLESGTTGNDFFNGQILFYGPDPLVATSPGWNDACLFRFDPGASGTDRSTQIADCNIDIWQYLNFNSDGEVNSNSVKKTRCQEEKTMPPKKSCYQIPWITMT